MKKFSKIIVVICLLTTFVLSAVACAASGTAGTDSEGRYILNVPKIELSANVVSWQEVRYAEKFGIVINGDEENEEFVENNKTTFVYNGNNGPASIKVRAIGDNKETVTGGFSNSVNYTPTDTLDTPQKPVGVVEGETLVMNWEPVKGADEYIIKQYASKETESKTRKSTTTEIKIPLSELTQPGEYSFDIKAKSNDITIAISGNSDMFKHLKSVQLESPVPLFEDGDSTTGRISWEKVEDANQYALFIAKGNDEFKKVGNTANNSWSESAIAEDIEEYDGTKLDAEDKELPWDDQSDGLYTFKIQAYNTESTAIYIPSKIVDVKLDSDKTTIAKVTKPAAPTGVAIDPLTGKVSWDKLGDYNKYEITLVSGGISRTKIITLDDKQGTSFDLAEFPSIKDTLAGMVFEVSISVSQENNKDTKAVVLDGIKELATGSYTYVATESPSKFGGTGDYKDHLAIKKLGDIAYMLANPAEKYILNNNIDGVDSNIKGSLSTINFTGEFYGNNKIIKDVNFVEDVNGQINLFGNVTGKVSDFTLSNVGIESINGLLDVSLIAHTNSGTISNVYVVKSVYNIAGEFNGLVGTNTAAGKINNVGLVYVTINVVHEKTNNQKLSAVGIVGINHGTVHNASVMSSIISIKAPQFDKETTNVRTGVSRTLTVAGIALENHGDITYSMVYKSEIFIQHDDNTIDFSTKAVAAGLVANNVDGTISFSYAEGENDSTRMVYIHTQNFNVTSTAIAGGLVGTADSITMTSTYYASGVVSAKDNAAGLIGLVSGSGSVAINDSFVHSVLFRGAKVGYITSVKSTITNSNTYYRVSRDNASNEAKYDKSGAVQINVSDFANLVNGKINGFTKNTQTHSEYPVLSGMLYVEGTDRVTNKKDSAESKRNTAIVYHGNSKFEVTEKTALTEIGFYVDKYKLTLADGKIIILPIMNEISN